MFTGIIEAVGEIADIFVKGTNKTFKIKSSIIQELKIDQSLCHDGVCLTIEALYENMYQVTAIHETLVKTAINDWKVGSYINLERSLLLNSRIDGHFVQGHVDTTGFCKKINNYDGSWEFTFEYPEAFAPLIIEKGSICVNGISLTAFNVTQNLVTVAIIPYTWNNTNLRNLKEGDNVNLEFDMIGKYLQRKITL